jgi:beta-galactosidase
MELLHEAPVLSRHTQTDTYNGRRGRNFSRGWAFHLGDAPGAQSAGFDDSAWRRLDLPHDWSIELPFNPSSPSGAIGGFLDGGVVWYRKTFTLPEAYSEKRVFIGVDGAYMNSQVWVNGVLLGARPYGYISFEYELTPHLRFGASNAIAIQLNHNQPTSRWYSGSGIYRNVWLTVLDPVHVDYCGLFVTATSVSQAQAAVRLSARTLNQAGTARPVALQAVVLDSDERVVASRAAPAVRVEANGTHTFDLTLAVPDPRRWSLEAPSLYTLRAEVTVDGRAVDTYLTPFGIRTFGMDPETGSSLNGVPLKLNGVCLHHDLGALGAAVNHRAIERQLQIMKAMGCNAIRTSHNPPEPMLLDLCDRMGLLVIDEAFDAWKEGNKVANDYHLYFEDWARTDIQAMVRRDRNHPCVVMYSIGNEVHDVVTDEGAAWAQTLVDWVREADSTRLVTHGSNFNEWGTAAAAVLDAVGYNYNIHLYDLHHSQFPHWKMYASETSSALRSRGIYRFPNGENLMSGPDQQCSSYDNSIARWGHSAEQSWREVNSRPFIAGEFIWTGFDYLGEPTPYDWPSKGSYFGIVDTCGFPKDIYFFYQSRWTEAAMVHLLPHWNWSAGQSIPVWAYTNCDSVELFLNGASLGTRAFQPDGPLHLEWLVPFEPGTLRAEARRGGAVAAAAQVQTAGPPARLSLAADREAILADGEDLAFVAVQVLDARGVPVPDASDPVTFSIAGPGRIVAVDNGNAPSTESFRGSVREAFSGKCLAIVQATGPGPIQLTAEASGLLAGTAAIVAEAVPEK